MLGAHAATAAVGFCLGRHGLLCKGLKRAAALIKQCQRKCGVARSLPRRVLFARIYAAQGFQQNGRQIIGESIGIFRHTHTPKPLDHKCFFQCQMTDQFLNGKLQRHHGIDIAAEKTAVFFFKKIAQQAQGLFLTRKRFINNVVHVCLRGTVAPNRAYLRPGGDAETAAPPRSSKIRA